MNKSNRNRINDLNLKYQRERYPNVPEHALLPYKGKDNSTNGLTNCVVDFLIFNGWQAERVSNTGRWLDNSKTVQDVVGFKRKIGSGKYIPGTGTNGSADIHSTINSMSVKIEIKYGRDVQSAAQKKYQQQIERAGGQYWIVRTFDGFVEKYDDFIAKTQNLFVNLHHGNSIQ